MHTTHGPALADTLTTDEPEQVRVLLEHNHAPRERMWGLLVGPGRVRLSNISRFCDAGVGDVFEAEPVCGCDYVDDMPHYVALRQVSRGSRRLQMFTKGTSRKRGDRVLDYLSTWPAADGATYGRPFPGILTPGMCPCCGEPLGIMAHGVRDDEHPETHWVLALPLDADEQRIAAFLDRVPALAWHELMPEEAE